MAAIAGLALGAASALAQYADPTACAGCHQQIAETYARTGMARSFGMVRAGTPIPEIQGRVFRHDASEQFFSIVARPSQPYLRRHQLGFDGTVGNIVEKQVAYWIGSGNHARSYISRKPSGELVELPITWYAENGGHWGMSPGYDRPDHAGFSRKITYQCMFCHNAYPEIEPGSDSQDRASGFPARLPEGIDCQRCHGPGSGHIDAVERGESLDVVRRAIVNPARLAGARQMEICLQCHLETTNLRLPPALVRFDRGIFSYRPGEPLENYILHFDHAPGAGYDDKFEFSGSAYRLRKSACFLASRGALTCTTCHNPHDIPRGAAAADRYSQVCRSCHGTALAERVRGRLHPESNDCVSCHMPKRRPSDAVHVAVTDHYIGKRPEGDPPGPLVERHDNNTPPYRGEVVPYYPLPLPPTPENELYLAVAQVKHQANLRDGLQLLEAAIAKYAPQHSEFSLELAEAYRHAGRPDKAAAFFQEAGARAPSDWRPFYGLGITLAAGDDPLKHAVSLAPREVMPLQALAKSLLTEGKPREAISALQKALELDPESAEVRNDLGTALFRLGDAGAAEKAVREAVRLRPEVAALHVNLAELLSRRRRFPEAEYHFEMALRIDPSAAEAHSAFATALAATGKLTEAREQYQAALRIDPQLAVTRNNLGALLLRLGDVEGAIREYRLAIAARPDSATAHYNLALALAGQGKRVEAEQSLRNAIQYAPDYFEAHLKLGQMLVARGESALAEPHLRKAAESPDPQVRGAANEALGTPR